MAFNWRPADLRDFTWTDIVRRWRPAAVAKLDLQELLLQVQARAIGVTFK